ncbi:MAG: hypothetical protein JOY83_09390 [Alphaproteobacteria bacterium]|nr:hypothetical protein [Alphaproteobacteria bacterium]
MAKAIDPQRDNHIAGNRAEPRQCRGVTIADHDQRGAGTKLRQQTRALLTLLAVCAACRSRPGTDNTPEDVTRAQLVHQIDPQGVFV